MIVKNPGMCLKVERKCSNYNNICKDHGLVSVFYSNEDETRCIERSGVVTEEPIETNYFFWDHYKKIKVLKDDVKTRCSFYTEYDNGEIKGHELVGKKFNSENGIATVASVHKHFSMGNYLILLYEINGSHGTKFYQNIDCNDPHILEKIVETKIDWL